MADLEAIKKNAREASELLGDRIFNQALEDLHTRLLGALMANSDQDRQLQIVSEMKALKAIGPQLMSYINTLKLAQKGK